MENEFWELIWFNWFGLKCLIVLNEETKTGFFWGIMVKIGKKKMKGD